MHTVLAWQGKYLIKHTFLIKCAHSRLGEACSHVAAIISCVIRASQLQERSGATARTSQECTWLPTARDVSFQFLVVHQVRFSLKVSPAHVCDIKFQSKCSSSSFSQPRKACKIEPPTEDELDAFYKTLNSSKKKPGILKITPPYSKQFIPLSACILLPASSTAQCVPVGVWGLRAVGRERISC